jgi:DNA-binding LacI/PurR family transcriptional regulator
MEPMPPEASPEPRKAALVTMHDVAARAKVSRATVSKYFNGSQSLKPATRARIEQACRDLEYVPDPHAVSLVKGRSNLLGVILPVISEPFFAEALRAIEAEAAAIGMDVIIQCSYNDPASEAEALLAMRSMKVSGVVLTAVASRDNLELLLRLEKEMRIVYLDSYVHPDCNYVMNDNQQSTALLTRYLLSHGHKPAYLGAPPVAFPSPQERLAGYMEAMKEAGLPACMVPTGSEPSWDFEDYAMRHVLNWLGSGAWKTAGITALVCGTDRLAIGAMAACRRFGLVPGKDLAFVGHDDLPICKYLFPALTTCKQDVASIGRAAIECLNLQMNSTAPLPLFQRRFASTLIVRESA